jgi:two-component system sensor histidine kinase YesM
MNKRIMLLKHKFSINLTIRQQILVAMLAVALFATAIIGIAIYSISKSTIEKNYSNLRSNNLQMSSRIVELQTEPIIEIGRSLLVDKVFRRIMQEETSSTPYFSGTNQLTLDKTLSSLMALDENIAGMTVVNENGNWRYFSKNSTVSSMANHYYTTDDLLEQPWVEAANEANGREFFFGYNVILPDTDTGSFCFVKKLINIENSKSMGYLVVHIRDNLLERAFTSSIEGYRTDRYMVVSQEGSEVILSSETDSDSMRVAHSEYLNRPVEGTETDISRDSRYIFSSAAIPRTGWEIVTYIERSELSQESAYIGRVTMGVGVLLVLISVLISGFISSRISKPLKLLEKTIEDVGSGSRRITAEFDQSEIGHIGMQFKQMVNENLDLQDRLLRSEIKEKEAELLLLQAQINPHFLYNTLDSLYFMALIRHDDEIADMVQVLSNSFKLSLNKGERFITVENELTRIQEYMKIQNIRYNNRFELGIEADDEIRKKKILTFVLQPFVENSVYHGLEARVGSGFVRVICKTEQDHLQFVVEDNGIGIQDPGRIESGYGIRNVRERIQLLYGCRYGVRFEDRQGGGTRVIITLPDQEVDYVSDGCN